MHPMGFEPAVSVKERPPTYALDPAGTGTGTTLDTDLLNILLLLVLIAAFLQCTIITGVFVIKI